MVYGAKKLHKMVDEILYRLGFFNVNNEDYYSLAHEIFTNILENYDDSQSFKGFLYSCLYKKFCTDIPIHHLHGLSAINLNGRKTLSAAIFKSQGYYSQQFL